MPPFWKNNNLEFIGKKFDIRQWILLVPPRAFIFSQFYLRICSENYEYNLPSNLQANLANYSINKANFQSSKESSVMSEENFK